MRIFSEELHDRFRRKPVSSFVLLVLAYVAFVMGREVGLPFLEGMYLGFTDGV